MLQTLAVTSVAQGFDASAKQIEDLKTNLNAPVDEAGLITADMALPQGTAATDTLADGDVGGIFGIDLDLEEGVPAPSAWKQPAHTARKQPIRTRQKTQRAGSSNAEVVGQLHLRPRPRPRPALGGRPTAERRLRDAARRCPVRPAPRRDWRCLSESSTGSSWRPDQAPRILFVEWGPAFWLARKNFPHGQPRRSPGGP